MEFTEIKGRMFGYSKKDVCNYISELNTIHEADMDAKKSEFSKKQEEMELMFLMDRFGYIKTIDLPTFERNKEAALNENRFVFNCKNTGKICIFTDYGQLHTIKVADIPFGKFRDKGIPVDNISNYDSAKESIVFVASQTDLNLYRVIFCD